jgi:hypothetical protein
MSHCQQKQEWFSAGNRLAGVWAVAPVMASALSFSLSLSLALALSLMPPSHRLLINGLYAG